MSQINTISTLNSTVTKKREIQEETDKCGGFCKKRIVREPTFCEHDHVLLEFPTWMSCVVIVWMGGAVGNVERGT
jgi:hypothetical protein